MTVRMISRGLHLLSSSKGFSSRKIRSRSFGSVCGDRGDCGEATGVMVTPPAVAEPAAGEEMSTCKVAVLYRAFGQTPTEEEMRGILRGSPTLVDFDAFVALFRKNYRIPTPQSALIAALQVFDTNNSGLISRDEIRKALCHLAEPLTSREADQILSLVPADDTGKFDYTALARV
uniref:EF-hand domain-containing protein n=1 Tax=Chromera velia CCMP2878 TaxID=1169474 RepID=A0A0G4IC78_9ALVE|eukprot:Cvel_12961.t1-p1 / transcript=Cvel_12961.t1 / gene=Cvel_12961 / organism=Chromera_velia_CCMP2878 / gene_product=Calmodulin, putative / transcript_product=Calmodulin, putative / location=Cvel_scaffold867:57598-61245(-) / protein_length=174 / sequence_SO=supercontig / SO=protein_coding / is_pseudo=false